MTINVVFSYSYTLLQSLVLLNVYNSLYLTEIGSIIIINTMQSNNPRLQILFAIFIALIVGMNLLGIKIVNFFFISTSVGIFMAPLTFLITDIVEEVYGKKIIQYFITGAAISLVLTIIYVQIFVILEPANRFVEQNTSYVSIFSNSLRLIFASLLAFLLSQFHDMQAFDFWRKKTKGRALWLRNNLSTIISQLIDTSVFMFVAFYKITPKFTADYIIQLIIPYFFLKLIFALIDTPFVYLGVIWLKKGEKNYNQNKKNNE